LGLAAVSALSFRELTASSSDRAVLRRFYDDVYTPEFPDLDERESLVNIERYLELKSEGWYGNNAYHVIVVESAGEAVAGVIADYLAEPNAGVIEFLVVTPALRGRGLGRRLHDHTEAVLVDDARRAGHPALDYVVAEINDPFRIDLAADNLDPFLRARVWGGWGYRKLDFPYVQPALSETQQPVHHLMLAMKPVVAAYAEAMPAARLRDTVRAYLRWAMRIPDPDANAEYQAMQNHLAVREGVPSIPLARYVGHDPTAPLDVEEIVGEGPTFDRVVAVYSSVFPPGATSIDPAIFRLAVSGSDSLGAHARYHLWALRDKPGSAVAGMASFFSLPGVGFGGYVALAPPLRGRRRLRSIGARIEEQMRRDKTGARGWLIECEPDSKALAIFERLGFREVALVYHQPALPSHEGQSPRLALGYKEFGAVYGTPDLRRDELREMIHAVFDTVYGVTVAEHDGLMAALDAQMGEWPTDAVEWRQPFGLRADGHMHRGTTP